MTTWMPVVLLVSTRSDPSLILDTLQTVMDIDTVGTFNMSRAAFPQLRETGGWVGG
jgi:hypothetical protein